MLGADPVTGLYDLVATFGTEAIGIETGPVFCIFGKTVCKAEVNRTANGGNKSVGVVAIVGHQCTVIGSPTSKGTIAHNIHCRIGVQANEGNQHG